MDILVNQNQLSFSAKFLDNKAFREVVKYADDTKQLLELDSALNRINNANQGDILLIHGKTPEGVYSNFYMNKRAVQNLGAETPEKASFLGIIELGKLGRKFRRLIGGDVKQADIKVQDIIDKYSVKNG